jgi:hypothetical protein
MDNHTRTFLTLPYWYVFKEGVLGEIQVSGLIKIENDKILLEYQTDTDAFNKLMIYLNRKLKGSFQPTPTESGSIQYASIPIPEIDKIEITTDFWQSTGLLYIQAKKLSTFQDIPGRKAGTLELVLRKKDAKALRKLIPENLRQSS